MNRFNNLSFTKRIIAVLFLIAFACCLLGIFYMETTVNKPQYKSLDALVDELKQHNESIEDTQQVIIQATLQQIAEPKIDDLALTVVAQESDYEENTSTSNSDKVNINTATVEQLLQLKGIGPAKAKAIVAERERGGPYTSIEDIKRVKGIGEKIYQSIKESLVN